jgi:hypothetical protein
MGKIERKRKILVTFGILVVVGVVSIGANGIIELGFSQTNSIGNQTQTNTSNMTANNTTSLSITTPVQTNSTGNQTSISSTPTASTTVPQESTTPAQEKASSMIRGAISETGEFIGNASQKVTTSKSAGALLNDTSNTLGNAYVETQKFFNPN